MSSLKPAQLNDPTAFVEVWAIDHRSVATALRPHIWKGSPVSAAYIAANLAALALVAVTWIRLDLSLFAGFQVVSLGMFSSYFALVPLHETIHAIAYRRMGATTVRVDYRWRRLTAACTADGFVASKREFAWVCLAPFLTLNPLLCVVAILSRGSWRLAAASALLLHVGACSGDFALLNWLYRSGYTNLFTYDDSAAQRSYFFSPRKETSLREVGQ